MALTIVSRAQWGARHEDGFGAAPLPAREVWLHHSVTVAPDLVPPFNDEHAAMRILEQIGETRFGRGVSYTFAVMPTGRVYGGHGIARQGAHTGGRNSIARAICWVGNYDVHRPTPQQIEATAQLLVDGWRDGWWTQPRLAGGHQQAPGAATACPGRHAMAAIPAINSRAAALAAGAPPALEDDMPLTPDEIERIAARSAERVWTWVVTGTVPHMQHRVKGTDDKTGVLGLLPEIHTMLRELTGRPASSPVAVDATAVATALEQSKPLLAAIADAVNDDADLRARDGDPATGPAT